VPLEEGYVPLYARRGPAYVVRELPRVQEALRAARGRAQQEHIRAVLAERPYLDMLLDMPLDAGTPIPDLLKQTSRVVLLGKPGAGKSTALRYLAAHPVAGKDGDLLTLIVDLPAYGASGQTLPEFLLHLVPDNVVKAMAQGDVLPVIFFAILFGLFLIRLNGPNV
ncbi:MAG: cation:dicarboxylate symporter family transporter, partial [Anaerolineae bacterium]